MKDFIIAILSSIPTPRISFNKNGLLFIIIGSLMLNGGSFGIKSTPDSDWINFKLPQLNSWICLMIIWMGIDTSIFRGNATSFILRNTIQPPIMYILKHILPDKWVKKLEDSKDEN